MPLSEIPAKLLEKTESLTETKLNIAASLTSIKCSQAKEEWDEEKILKTYFKFYQGIKDITPPPLEKFSQKKVNKYVVMGSIIFTLIIGVIVFLIYFPK